MTQESRGETPSQELEREWAEQEAAEGGAAAPTNQLVAAGEWVFRLPKTSAEFLVVHIVHFANGSLARCKCGKIVDLAGGVHVLPAEPGDAPKDEQQCQKCWGTKPESVPISPLKSDRK